MALPGADKDRSPPPQSLSQRHRRASQLRGAWSQVWQAAAETFCEELGLGAGGTGMAARQPGARGWLCPQGRLPCVLGKGSGGGSSLEEVGSKKGKGPPRRLPSSLLSGAGEGTEGETCSVCHQRDSWRWLERSCPGETCPRKPDLLRNPSS